MEASESNWSKADCSRLVNWREGLNPLTLDIVGDFAGEELFAIHGEALLIYCIRTARVDYGHGFQLLHAIHAIESFLSKLSDRGCNFHIVWFDGYKHLCMPHDVPDEHAYMYLLTRAVIIQHLPNVNYRFTGFSDNTFRHYLRQTSLHFFMCCDGGTTHLDNITDVTLDRLSIGYRFACSGICLAFIDDIEFRSSKVNTRLVTASQTLEPLSRNQVTPSRNDVYLNQEIVTSTILGNRGSPLTARDIIMLNALAQVLKNEVTEVRRHHAAAILVHVVMLRHYDLSQRSFPQLGKGLRESGHDVMAEFCEAATNIIDGWQHIWDEHCTTTVKWDAFDLIDGRLYLHVENRLNTLSLPSNIIEELGNMSQLLTALCGVNLSRELPNHNEGVFEISPVIPESNVSTPSVLPFKHDIMDQYLNNVHLTTEVDTNIRFNSQVFLELVHWHNGRKSVDPKHVPKPRGFMARKNNQRFMADTIAYSASLRGSSGKTIDPEIIVVQQHSKGERRSADDGWRTALKEKQASKSRSHPNKGGRHNAIEAAKALKAEKAEEKSAVVISAWKTRCSELEKEKSLMKKYMTAERYLRGLSSAHMSYVGAEVSLYICHILNEMRDKDKLINRDAITAMLWSHTMETSRLPVTPDVSEQLYKLARYLKILLNVTPSPSPIQRGLPFAISEANLKSTNITRPWEFQLNHCGPYMERSFDSAPDARVPFQPDAWQRKVLDAIDENKSLLVVAPTSAGKTFISFYAMKKVLKANDDDIIVYVAPTKALVNQIAAEVQAQFSKSYHQNHDGRSVWAIHTRDYRVNNPNGCQVLITVPHILQIMLLAPYNAKTPNSWSRRVKRIIFDEVHCIGQSEDGVIWEQLLLLAPCPIIALSATIGNPLEFKSWLEATQRVKGFNLEMITHGSRYSDLRKFLYEPPEFTEFQGLKPVNGLPFPGLDSGNSDKGNKQFTFIHPIGSLIRKDRVALNDTSLEPRDCLSLWRCMKEHNEGAPPLSKALDPENFLPAMIKKSDVVEWESALKKELGTWMISSKDQFDAVQGELRGRGVDLNGPPQRHATPRHLPKLVKPYFSLIIDLRSSGALPAIIFNFDRSRCEAIVIHLLNMLKSAESRYQEGPKWKAKMEEFENWKKANEKMQAKTAKRTPKRQGTDDEGMSKFDMLRDKADQEDSPWKRFDPDDPLAEFSFADGTKLSKEELQERIKSLEYHRIKPEFIQALRRGLGVHHAGMNRQYRQVVEILFRKGYLTVVVATGTLALGLNMPCKTVVFSGDSVFITALQYRQASGRAGRRGFDVLGNVVFQGIPRYRALEIMSSRLPNLRGQFPTSVTLILRLFTLLHGTNNSDYACNAVKSLLSQNRLYLGGPETKLAVEHHLRFSIDYLRRQNLLSEVGEPLNFSGIVGHLYYTENAAFAFHYLLEKGYFHAVCQDILKMEERGRILLHLMLVLCHLFCRIPCTRHKDQTWLYKVVHSSPSLVLLPDLPLGAADLLDQHNRETLQIFQNYVKTFAAQHLVEKSDDLLPFTKQQGTVGPETTCDMRGILPSLPETTVASPFAALSGFTDEFETIGDLCRMARSDVFLEESAIPYIPIAPHETNGVPWNAYIFDFFKHGDLKALVRDNQIKSGDVWFRLKDFSLVLATIVTSLGSFLNSDGEADGAEMIDVQDAGDALEENAGLDVSEYTETEDATTTGESATSKVGDTVASRKAKGKKKAVAESWEDEDISDNDTDDKDGADVQLPSGSKHQSTGSSHGDVKTFHQPSWANERQGESLVKVYIAFSLLREEFDTKFRKVWA